MKAGQTFALAGLVQERSETVKRGVPYVMDVPVLGVPFRRMEDDVNEIELLILVTPEFVDPLDACEAPCGGPGTFTTQPSDRGLYCTGHVEVPTYVHPTQGLGSCGQDPCSCCQGGNGQCVSGDCAHGGCQPGGHGVMVSPTPVPAEGMVMPGGTGYDESASPMPESASPAPAEGEQGDASPTPLPPQNELPPPSQQGRQPFQGVPDDLTLPAGADQQAVTTPEEQPAAVDESQGPLPSGAYYQPAYPSQPSYGQPAAPAAGGSASYTSPRPYSPPRQPVFMRNASRPYNPQWQPATPAAPAANSLIGPVGYDAQ
jgi:hypothetical protein